MSLISLFPSVLPLPSSRQPMSLQTGREHQRGSREDRLRSEEIALDYDAVLRLKTKRARGFGRKKMRCANGWMGLLGLGKVWIEACFC